MAKQLVLKPTNNPVSFVATIEQEINTLREKKKDWLNLVGGKLSQVGEVTNIAVLIEAGTLYLVSEMWPDIPLEQTAEWGNDFYKWAAMYTQRSAVIPSKSTINNKIGVWRDYFSEHAVINPPPTVYREIGDPDNPEAEPEVQEFEGDLSTVSYSKLLIARGPAKRDELDEDAWADLLDPNTRVKELKNTIKKAAAEFAGEDQTEDNGDEDRKKTITNGAHFFEESGILYLTKDDHTVGIAQFIGENSEHPLYKTGVERVLRVFGLEPDADVLKRDVTIDPDLPPIMWQDEDIVLNFDGIRLARMDKIRARTLANTIIAVLDGDMEV